MTGWIDSRWVQVNRILRKELEAAQRAGLPFDAVWEDAVEMALACVPDEDATGGFSPRRMERQLLHQTKVGWQACYERQPVEEHTAFGRLIEAMEEV